METKKVYKLDLYKPSGEYAGILDVYNLNVDLSIEDFSSISFNIPSYIDGEFNKRVYEVLDLYEVVLKIREKKYRFTLRSTPSSFGGSSLFYSYEGLSSEANLDKKIKTGWPGVERTVSYEYKTIKKRGVEELDGLEGKNINFTVSLKYYDYLKEKTIDEIKDIIEVVEVREYENFIKKSPLFYLENTGSDFFKRGAYSLNKTQNNLNFIFPVYTDTDVEGMSNSLKIRYEIFLNPPFEIKEEKEGSLLISEAAQNIEKKKYLEYGQSFTLNPEQGGIFELNFQEDARFFDRITIERHTQGGNYEPLVIEGEAAYGDFECFNTYCNYYFLKGSFPVYFHIDFNANKISIEDPIGYLENRLELKFLNKTYNKGTYYSKIGVTLEDLLDYLLIPEGWTYYIDDKIKDLRRSDFEFNNISVYNCLQEIKDSFDIIFIVDSFNKEIKFYKEYLDIEGITLNNISLEEGHYLKSLEKSLDTQNLATNIYGIGKDYITTSSFSPTGSFWFDYSYYLDEYWEKVNSPTNKRTILINYLKNQNTVIVAKSRWMSNSLAAKMAIYQLVRDEIARVYLGDVSSELYDILQGSEVTRSGQPNRFELLKKSENLVYEREEDLNFFTKEESRFLEIKSQRDYYGTLRDHAAESKEDLEYFEKYEEMYNNYSYNLTENEGLLIEMEEKLFSQKKPENLDRRYGYLVYKNRSLLEEFLLDTLKLSDEESKELSNFRFDYVLQDDTVVSSRDLFLKIKEYAEEHSQPEISLKLDIVDILSTAEASDEDRESLFLGNFLYVDFPMFNIKDRVQIKGMSIDFDSNRIDLEISNLKKGSSKLLDKIINNIRDFKKTNENYVWFEKDEIQKNRESLKYFEEKERGGKGKIGKKGSSNYMSEDGIVIKKTRINPNLDVLESHENEVFYIRNGDIILIDDEGAHSLKDFMKEP